MNYPHVQYYLDNPILGSRLVKSEPLNWDDDDKKLVRNLSSYGVFTELSSNLEFVRDAKDYIVSVFENQGTEAELILERWELRDIDEGYELDYKGHLDLKTYINQDIKVSVQFLTGGLQALVESQLNEDYELERTTDIDGNAIGNLEYETIQWNGRRLFLESFAERPESAPNFFEIFNVQGNNQIAGYPVNVNVSYQSEGLEINSVFQNNQVNLTPYSEIYIVQGVEKPNGAGVIFFNDTENAQTFSAKSIYSFEYSSLTFAGDFNKRDRYTLIIGIAKYQRINDAFEWSENIILKSNDTWWQQLNNANDTGYIQDETDFIDITVNPQEGIVFTPYLFYSSSIPPNVFDQFEINIFNYNFNIKFEENSSFEATSFNSLKLYGAFERMLKIYTGEDERFYSDFLLNSEFKDVLISSGRHIRNLPLYTQGSSPRARISISLEDLYGTNNYFNLGWHVETIKGKEIFVVEEKSYYFQPEVILDLGIVSNFVEKSDASNLFKSAEFGNDKAGDYEELQGLQEYNAKTKYVTALKTSNEEYDVTGKVRADLVGAELARRKNYTVEPNTDTRYDNENFLFDCKPQGDDFTPKVWQDSLASEPICYDPPTAGNLLLTPFRSMVRHSNCFNAGTKAYRDLFTRYASGTVAVDVATQLPDEPIRYENGDIINRDLKTPIYEAVEYTFNKPVTNEIRKILNEKTLVNGRYVPNVYFLIKFVFKSQTYFGYISEISYNDVSEWKLIKRFE